LNKGKVNIYWTIPDNESGSYISQINNKMTDISVKF